MNLRTLHQPPSLLELKGEALKQGALKWKPLESACIIDILKNMEQDFFPKLNGASFEKGINLQGIYELDFNPNKDLVEYYQLIECRHR